MKHLKKYNLFKEENEFDVQVTDAPDLKMSKEKLTSLSNQIKDFKQKKLQIDQIYLKTDDDVELKRKIESLLGPKDIKPREDRNPFLVEYLNISDLKRRLQKVQNDNINDKVKLDDFNQQLKSSTANQQTTIKSTIDDINKRMGLANTTISKLKSDITKAEKSLTKKMIKQESDLKAYIKNIKISK